MQSVNLQAHVRMFAVRTADMRPGNTACGSPGVSIASRIGMVPQQQTM